MKTLPIIAAAAAFALTACGEPSTAENTADALEEAAEYSTPEAANVLDNAAEQVRDQNISDPGAADRALDAAGNAQAPAPPPEMQGNGQ